jgi:hypothetical protein
MSELHALRIRAVPELLIRRGGDQGHGYRAAKALAELNWQPLGCKAAMRGAFLMSVAMSVAFGGRADTGGCTANVCF